MANKRLTDARVRALRSREERYTIWEGGGFGVRVAPSGRKTFIFMYRFNGKARRLSLDRYPAMSLATARENIAKAQKILEKGIDPGEKLVHAKRAERGAETIADLCNEYMEKWAKPNKRSWKEDQRILNKDIIPVWGRKKAKDITRRDVIALLDGIVDRGSPIQANRTLACIRKVFNFGLSRDIVNTTPCAAIKAPSKENRRDRVLNENDIKAFWFGLDKARMNELTKLALKFQLLTAQRKGEVLAAEWADFDIHSKVWDIPGEKTKNGLPHRVPLSPSAMELLETIKAQPTASRWLFPGNGRNDTHIIGSSIDHAVRNNSTDDAARNTRDVFEIEPGFVPHDLRRTAASHMTSMGIPRLVVSKILNHTEAGVTSVYDRHSYDKEKRRALNAWGQKLESILTGKKGKVINIR